MVRQATVRKMLQISGKFTAARKRTGAEDCLTMKKEKIPAIGGRCGSGRSGIVCFRPFPGRAGLLVYQGTHYIAEQHGKLLMFIVIIGVICTAVMAACRTK